METRWAAILAILVIPAVAGVTVNTQYGEVHGQTFKVHDGSTVHSFWAIPYAQADRFEEPRDPEDYPEGGFNASTLGAACPQSGRLIWYTHPFWNNYDEDCLHLNVFAPENLNGQHAVMVYFHGGAYSGSANIQYPGYFLAARDVVVVVANYRLGMLGFFSADDPQGEDDSYHGNYGLWDQHAALEWVSRNIDSFGGDPRQVTIFGQSAGASSVGLHMMSQRSRHLFDQAITQSGNELTFWAVNWPNQDPDQYGRQVAEQAGCPTEDIEEMVECLRQQDPMELVSYNITCAPGYFCMGFVPVIDGPGHFIHDYPWNLREDDNFKKCPLMSGICTEDGSLYTIAYIPESMDGGFTREEFQYHLNNSLLAMWREQFTDEEYLDVYKAFEFYYSPWPHINDTEANREAFNTLVTDGAFGMPTDIQLKHQATFGDPRVWNFMMGFRSTNASNLVPEWMGVPHQGELPYVFGYPLLELNPDLRDDSRIHFDIIDWNQEDIEYAEYIATFWTNFAKSGNPNLPDTPVPPLGNEEVHFPQFNLETYEQIVWARDIYADAEYRQRNFALYTEYFPFLANRNCLFPNDPISATKSENSEAKGLDSSLIHSVTDQLIMEALEERFSQLTESELKKIFKMYTD